MLTTPVQRITGTCTRGTRVSSSPSKIPYGGFSPVRLQTGIPAATFAHPEWFELTPRADLYAAQVPISEESNKP